MKVNPKWFYGGTSIGVNQYGRHYGYRNAVAGIAGKHLYIDWVNGVRGDMPILDEGIISEHEVYKTLPKYQMRAKTRRQAFINSSLDEVTIVIPKLYNKTYNWTLNMLINGTKVNWVYKDETLSWIPYPVKASKEATCWTYDCDYVTIRGKKMPYPTLVEQYTDEAPAPEVSTKALELVQRYLPDAQVPDNNWWIYDTKPNVGDVLADIFPMINIVEKYGFDTAQAVRVFAATHIATMQVDIPDGLAIGRETMRTIRKEWVEKYNPELRRHWQESAGEDTSFWFPWSSETNFNYRSAISYIWAGQEKPKMFFTPKAMKPTIHMYGFVDDIFEEAEDVNQLGLKTPYEWRDYVKNQTTGYAEGSKPKPSYESYIRSKERYAYKQQAKTRAFVNVARHKTSTEAMNQFLESELPKEEFLAEGYVACKVCGEVYRPIDAEMADALATDDSDYTLYGDWAGSKKLNIVFGTNMSIRNNDIGICPHCLDNLTLTDLKIAFPELKRAIRIAEKRGIAPEVIMSNVLEIL